MVVIWEEGGVGKEGGGWSREREARESSELLNEMVICWNFLKY